MKIVAHFFPTLFCSTLLFSTASIYNGFACDNRLLELIKVVRTGANWNPGRVSAWRKCVSCLLGKVKEKEEELEEEKPKIEKSNERVEWRKKMENLDDDLDKTTICGVKAANEKPQTKKITIYR